MRVILIPIGSAGDVFPYLAIGRRLRERGHDAVVVTSGYFRQTVEAQGLRFREFGTAEQFRQIMQDPNLWHPMRGFKTVMAAMHDQAGLMRTLESELQPGCVMVAHSLAFAARLLQEKLGAAMISITLQPAVLRSFHEGPTMSGSRRTSDMPLWLQRGMWWIADRFMVDPYVARVLDPLRDSLGLPRIRRFFREWIFSPDLTIATFPEWFAARQPDWPGQLRQTGFPLSDCFGGETPAELETLLASGDPPIVFTPGSANIHAREFFTAAAGACHKLSRRGVLLTRHPEQLPASLPAAVSHFPFAPLSQILPRCAALVHHGGIGTTAAGLAAGVPQLIMPLSHDQPDNAARVLRLGAGTRLWPRQFTAERVAASLQPLLESADVRHRCQDYACRCAAQDGVSEAADLIEARLRA